MCDSHIYATPIYDVKARGGLLAGAEFRKSAAAEQIAAILEGHGVGIYGGRSVIRESTTMMFYGEEAEAMFEAMDQFLNDHLICAGAVVAIRQGSKLREVVIPQAVN